VRDFYESFWAHPPDAPDEPEPWEWERRRALLLDAVQPGDRVLDLGTGAGAFLKALQQAGADPVGVEIAEAAAERARAATGIEVRLVEPDGTLPFAHGEFDLVWCSEVLEHVPDALALLQEARRVLKRDGRILLTVPYHGRFQAAAIALTRFDAHFDPLGQHVRFFTRRSLATILEHAGFEDARVRPVLKRKSLAASARRR
jgi:SAM-dependent methyltransferase